MEADCCFCRHGITFNQAPKATPAGPPGPQLGTAVQQPQPQEPTAQLLEGELEGALGDGEVQVCHIHWDGDGEASLCGGRVRASHDSHDTTYYIRNCLTRLRRSCEHAACRCGDRGHFLVLFSVVCVCFV